MIEINSHEACTIYTSPKDELIYNGHANANMFPVGRKRVKRNIGGDIPHDFWYETRYVKGGKFRVIR